MELSNNTFNIIMIFIISYFITIYKINKKIIYKHHIHSIESFPDLKKITNKLNENLKQIQEECDAVYNNNDKDVAFKRKEGNWTNDVADNYVNELKKENKWVHGWTQKDDWLNYLILYNGEVMDDIEKKIPTIYKILKPYFDKFNVVGLSLLLPNSKIPYHYDIDTNLENNRLTFHFNIYCPNDYNNKGKSILKIYNNFKPTVIEQKSGGHVIFDPSFYHSVDHDNPEYRLILYTDFNVKKMYRIF
jgi:hypothetical protein